MKKRGVSAVLWFTAIWVSYEVVWSLTGLPRLVGPILGVTMAFLVTVDPFHRIWPVQEKSASALSTFERRDALPSPTQSA